MSAYFEYYKVFYYVALCRSITGAAEKLSLTQPSVTRAIKNLESQLGLVLFFRSKQGVTLTPEGERLYARVAPACKLLFSAEEDLAQLKNLESGRVRIGMDNSVVSSPFFLKTLSMYKKRYPNIQIHIKHATVTYQQKLLDGGLDCCFLSGHGDDVLPPTLHRQPLFSYDDIAVVGPAYAALAEREISRSELAAFPQIRFGQDSFMDTFPPAPEDGQDWAAPSMILAGSLDFQIALAKAGFGYTFVPRSCVEEEIRHGALLPLKLTDCPLKRMAELVTPLDRSISYAAQRFVALAVDIASEAVSPASKE